MHGRTKIQDVSIIKQIKDVIFCKTFTKLGMVVRRWCMCEMGKWLKFMTLNGGQIRRGEFSIVKW